MERQRWNKPAVHIIDAEADSIGHYRSWLRQPRRFFVVRADNRTVQHDGKKRKFSQVLSMLWERHAFRRVRTVACRGRKGEQWVAETSITITVPARPNRRHEQLPRYVYGEPVTLRLVISQIRFADGSAAPLVWYLLTNVPAEVDAPQVALWYYWRWRIESFFKLLKSAGLHADQWRQESAPAVIRRLLVASMACVTVWQLQADSSPAAREVQQVLIRLSGRQLKRRTPTTAPALLAGLQVLFAMLDLLEHYSLHDLQRLVAKALPRFFPSG